MPRHSAENGISDIITTVTQTIGLSQSPKSMAVDETGDAMHSSNPQSKVPLQPYHAPLLSSLLRRRSARISWGGLAGILWRGRGASVPSLCAAAATAARGFCARCRRSRQKIAELLHEWLRGQTAFYPLQLLAFLEED